MQRRDKLPSVRRPKLCLSIGDRTVQGFSLKLKKARAYRPDLIELRLDLLKGIDDNKLRKIGEFLRGNEILTLRAKTEGGRSLISESERIKMIENSVLPLGPAFIDVEILTLRKHPGILRKIEASETSLIASFHDLSGKKTRKQLEKIALSAPLRSHSLYALKIVAEARSIESNLKLLSLYSGKLLKKKARHKLVAFCTGELGLQSRILSLFALSPFGYVSLPGEPLATGQMDINSVRNVIRVQGR
jgi:3-dehydroquinate dehydratase type I